MKNHFNTLTKIENIDDKEFGLNPICNSDSIGYLIFEKLQSTMKCYQELNKIFKTLNEFQKKWNCKIELNIEQENLFVNID